ncbi:MAG: hypothetical protein WC536_04720 [Patescibacteria group bacterium]|jgi:hypothetical protein
MAIKELLKNAIEGTGEIAESLASTVTSILKEGTEDAGEIFGAIVELGKEGVIDITEGVKDVYIGAVKSLEESGKSTEEAIGEVTTKAEHALGKVVQGGEDATGEAIKKGIKEAKEIVKAPFKS